MVEAYSVTYWRCKECDCEYETEEEANECCKVEEEEAKNE